MFDRHLKYWPSKVPHTVPVPETSVYYNLEVSARRYPRNTAIIYYGKPLTYGELNDQVERLAGYMQRRLGVAKGDRVLLYMQNSPQYVIGYYAILRADAVVIPVNPMNRSFELEHYVADTGARVALLGQELLPNLEPLLKAGKIPHAVVAAYGDYAEPGFDLAVPEAVKEQPRSLDVSGALAWGDALAAGERPGPVAAGPDDWAVFPYSSGTTGNPKGCIHTHRTVMTTIVGGQAWTPAAPGSVALASLPLFHVTGMQNCMNTTLYAGGTMVIMSRWDRRVAAELIQRYRVSRWRSISTMAIDLVNDPEIEKYDLGSLQAIGGGGAAMPEAIATKLKTLTGLDYVEGYGLSETMAATHINPGDRPKKQCLGIPVFGVDCRIIDPDSGKEVGPNTEGEIIMNGPQVFKGYWNDPERTAAAFMELDGKTFFRTGDIGYYDEEGYFFIVDRLKRMINASGFKVWPTEVEGLMYRHPAVSEVCIIASPDARRGETVKAVVVLRESHRGKVGEEEIIEWCRANMAAYKCPKTVEFADELPRSATGKLQWRALQDQEWAK